MVRTCPVCVAHNTEAEDYIAQNTPSSKLSAETKNLMKKRRDLKAPTNAREKIEAAELNKPIQLTNKQKN